MAKLYFYYSAMNAGKSMLLLQSAFNYIERGLKPLLMTSSLDTKIKSGFISSRVGLKKEAVLYNLNTNIYEFVKNKNFDCVLIDEAQFLTKIQVQELSNIVDYLHIPVLTFGIRTDFQGELFEGSAFLLAIADELVELKTICHCGKKAIMNLRVDEHKKPIREGNKILIGGNFLYYATCRAHFKEGLAI